MSADISGLISWLRGWFDDIYALKSEIPSGVTLDNTVTQNSSNAVKSSGIYTALSGKSDTGHSHTVDDVTNLAILFGGTWVQLKDRFLLGAGDTYTNGDTGGEASHTLTVDEMPVHSHGLNQSTWGWGDSNATESVQASVQSGYWGNNALTTNRNDVNATSTMSEGSGQAHNNLPPYLVVYIWKRINPVEISLSVTNPILSYAKTDSTTVSATLTGNNVNNKLVTFYCEGSVYDTAVTNNNGVCSISYVSEGVGDVSIYAECEGVESSSSVIEDCLFYGNWNNIVSTFNSTNAVSGRTIYYLNTSYTSDVSLEFKFKDYVPSTFLAGFGDTNGTSSFYSKCLFYNDNNTLKLFKDNNTVNIGNPSKTKNTIFKLTSNNLHSISVYLDDSLKTTQSTNSGHPLNLRIDSFTTSPVELEYLKVKPL